MPIGIKCIYWIITLRLSAEVNMFFPMTPSASRPTSTRILCLTDFSKDYYFFDAYLCLVPFDTLLHTSF